MIKRERFQQDIRQAVTQRKRINDLQQVGESRESQDTAEGAKHHKEDHVEHHQHQGNPKPLHAHVRTESVEAVTQEIRQQARGNNDGHVDNQYRKTRQYPVRQIFFNELFHLCFSNFLQI